MSGEPTVDAQPEPDWHAEAERLQSESRKHEERYRRNAAAARELETFKVSSAAELERATQAARDEVRAEVMATTNRRLVAIELHMGAAGRGVDAEALLEGIDVGRYVTEAGDVDTEAIARLLDGATPKRPLPGRGVDFGQGARGEFVAQNPAQQFGTFLQSELGR